MRFSIEPILIKLFTLTTRLSKILPQIHVGVQMRDLFFVAVKYEGRLLAGKESGADDSLALLTPARMIDVRVHVGVEPVLVRRELISKRFRLLRHKLDLGQRLRALETVLPRDDEPDRCSILIA